MSKKINTSLPASAPSGQSQAADQRDTKPLSEQSETEAHEKVVPAAQQAEAADEPLEAIRDDGQNITPEEFIPKKILPPGMVLDESGLMLISLDDCLRRRVPKVRNMMPRWVVRLLERLICQRKLNHLLRRHKGKRGAEFCSAVMKDLNVTLKVRAPFGYPDPTDRRVVIVSNHPLGGLDGVTLIDYFTRFYGGQVNVMVNDILSAIEPLSDVFMPVNKHGAQNKGYANTVTRAFESNDPIIIFPAGMVSRSTKKVISDLQWQKSFVTWSIRAGRSILPVHFDGRNSNRFYRAANFRKRLGLKLNYEMVFLPSEIFRSKGKTFTLTIGTPIPAAALNDIAPNAKVAQIRNIVYSLKNS